MYERVETFVVHFRLFPGSTFKFIALTDSSYPGNLIMVDGFRERLRIDIQFGDSALRQMFWVDLKKMSNCSLSKKEVKTLSDVKWFLWWRKNWLQIRWWMSYIAWSCKPCISAHFGYPSKEWSIVLILSPILRMENSLDVLDENMSLAALIEFIGWFLPRKSFYTRKFIPMYYLWHWLS